MVTSAKLVFFVTFPAVLQDFYKKGNTLQFIIGRHIGQEQVPSAGIVHAAAIVLEAVAHNEIITFSTIL